MVSEEKSKILGQWLEMGGTINAFCQQKRQARRVGALEEDQRNKNLLPLISHDELKEMLDLTIDEVSIRELLGVKDQAQVPDQCFLAVIILFHHHHVESGMLSRLPLQVLCSRICMVLSSQPQDLIWATRELIEQMVSKGVLKIDPTGVDLGKDLHRFIFGVQATERCTGNDSKVEKEFNDFVESIPDFSPDEIVRAVKDAGYVSQELPVKTVSLAVCRHLRRIKRVHQCKSDSANLPPVPHLLMAGPSGVGKTHLLRVIFEQILNFPAFTFVDCASLTQVGVVGPSVHCGLVDLYEKANGNPLITAHSILCMDECDKIGTFSDSVADSNNVSRVTTTGVQQSLLKLMEKGRVDLSPYLPGKTSSSSIWVPTGSIMFICMGAFPHRRVHRRTEQIGFGTKTDKGRSSGTDFASFGLMRELYGRFSHVVCFDRLSKRDLLSILSGQIAEAYREELALDGIRLSIDDRAYEALIEKGLSYGVGARGLNRAIGIHVQDAMFDAYSSEGEDKVIRIAESGGELVHEVHSV